MVVVVTSGQSRTTVLTWDWPIYSQLLLKDKNSSPFLCRIGEKK